VTIGPESTRDRDKRHHQRTLFNDIAERYEDSRPGYPSRVVEFVATTAALGPGASVLEIGCGTGQLTERLAARANHLTAIDIGPAMIAAARRRLTGVGVEFQVTSFEDLAAPDGSFDLIISLSPEAQHKAVDMTRTMACDVEFWNTFDPSIVEGSREQRMDAYRDVRDRLMDRIRERFPILGAPKI